MLNLARKVKRRLLGAAKSKRVSTPDVFVGLASIPARVDSLKKVIEGMLPQVEGIGVYLNNYDEVPEFLKHPKIQIARSQDHGDVRDNGKFFFLDKTSCAKYATIDDDIAYPSNYIERLLSLQEALGGTHAIGVHAVAYGRRVEKLLKGRYLWHFKAENDCLLPCNMVGTGTLLFDQRYFKLAYSEIGTPGMADVWFAVAAKKRGFTLWVAPRAQNWLHPIELEEVEPEEQDEAEDAPKNLYTEGLRDDSVQVDALNAAGISGSTHQFVEDVVRSPRASREFSLVHVAQLRNISEKHGYKILKHRESRLYDYALAVHKREGIKGLDARLVEVIDDYSEYQMRALSGVLQDRDFAFEKKYKALLRRMGRSNLPKFAQMDWDLLGLKEIIRRNPGSEG